MITDDKLKQLLIRHERCETERRVWESQWQEIRELVHPNTSDFNRVRSAGDRRTDRILDGTAPWALEQLASGLHSNLSGPTDRWFNLCIEDSSYKTDDEALMWLEDTADTIYHYYSRPDSNNNNSLHEVYMSLGAFGTGVEYQDWSEETNSIRFRSYPLADCWIRENANGVIDSLDRVVMMDTRKVEQMFPNHGSEQIKRDTTGLKMWRVIHSVFPRSDRDARKLNVVNKRYASFWFCKDAEVIFKESGYNDFPYAVPRWVKIAGETYGRSPAWNCMPDIRMIQAMERVQLKALQKIVDPPLMVPDDGFMLPIDTTPASLIFYESTMNPANVIQPLETKGRVEVGEEKMQQKRDHIMRCFYSEWLNRLKKKERQTQTEIMDDKDEILQAMSPILGRLQSELLGPRLARTYNLLLERRLIRQAPVSLQKKTLQIEYVSPAAVAQIARKGVNIQRFTEQLIPMAQVDPSIMDVIHPDRYASEMARYQDVSRKILRTNAELTEIRNQKQQQQQMAQMAQTAEPASNALKNVATAREKGLV